MIVNITKKNPTIAVRKVITEYVIELVRYVN